MEFYESPTATKGSHAHPVMFNPLPSIVFINTLLHGHNSCEPTSAAEGTYYIYTLLDDIHIQALKTDVRMCDAISCDPFVAVGDS